MIKTIILISLTGLLQTVKSQTVITDSLYKSILSMANDTLKTKKMRETGISLETSNPELARNCYQEAIKICQKISATNEELLTRLQLAGLYVNTNKYDSAEIAANEAVAIAIRNKSELDEGRGYNIIGNSFRRRSQYPEATRYYLKAVAIFEKLNDNKRTALVYSSIAAVFAETNEGEKGVPYGEKAIHFAIASKDPDALAKAYFNTGAAHAMADDEKYIAYYKKGIPYALQTNNPALIQQGYYNIANGYYQIGLVKKTLPAEAGKYADTSLQWANKTGNPLNMFYASNINAQIAIINNQLTEAETSLTLTAKSLEDVGSNFTNRIYYSTLAKLRYAQGRYKEAHNYRVKQDEYKDSILNEEKLDAQREIEAKFETEKKESKIALQQSQLKQKNTLNNLFGGSALAAVIIGLLSFRNYRNRKKVDELRIAELEAEKQLAATEAVLKGEEQERTRLAKDLHDGLGGMLSGIKYSFNTMKGNLVMTPNNAQAFERSMDMLDSSIKEMRRVAHNMMPEALVKFGLDAALKDFCNDINQSGALQVSYESIGLQGLVLSQSTSITIYRIVQELLNNTMKHAEAKTAIVQLSNVDNQLAVTVEDDGKGFDTAVINQENRGIGWSNIRNRTNLLNGKVIVEAEPGKGTTVNIEIPL